MLLEYSKIKPVTNCNWFYSELFHCIKGIDILIISDPVIYGEYKPYRFVEGEKEFIIKVFEM